MVACKLPSLLSHTLFVLYQEKNLLLIIIDTETNTIVYLDSSLKIVESGGSREENKLFLDCRTSLHIIVYIQYMHKLDAITTDIKQYIHTHLQ